MGAEVVKRQAPDLRRSVAGLEKDLEFTLQVVGACGDLRVDFEFSSDLRV